MAKIPGYAKQAVRMCRPIIKKGKAVTTTAEGQEGKDVYVPSSFKITPLVGKAKRRGGAGMWARGVVNRAMNWMRRSGGGN